MLKRVMLLGSLFLAMCGQMWGVPENLAGTDIFPIEVVVSRAVPVRHSLAPAVQETSAINKEADAPLLHSDKRKRDDAPAHALSRQQQRIEIKLPTKILNLSYGVECYMTILQKLYKFGEVVRLVDVTPGETTVQPVGGAVAPGDDGVIEHKDAAPVAAAQPQKIFEHQFYREIVK